jgi:hypothetical protein
MGLALPSPAIGRTVRSQFNQGGADGALPRSYVANGWRTAADLPVDEIIPIADTVIVRPDPQPATS